MITLHRKEQWDILPNGIKRPLMVIAWRTPNSYSRLFCLWTGGVWVRGRGNARYSLVWGRGNRAGTRQALLDEEIDRMIFDREAIAGLCHEQWSGWMKYLFSKGSMRADARGPIWVMPAWAVERWQRQMNTPYAELSAAEQDSDRAEADKFLNLIGNGVAERAFKAGFSIGCLPSSDIEKIDEEWEKWLDFMVEGEGN